MISAAERDALVGAAIAIREKAYVPYSNYQVGAAILGVDRQIYTGVNVENASYGLTQCAERNAIAHAVSRGVKTGELMTMVVYVPGDKPWPPCGACRQVLVEMMSPEGEVISVCDGPGRRTWPVNALMPEPFLPD